MLGNNYENKMFKLNYPLKNLKEGDKISLRLKDGIPVDGYWRDRFNDSKLDHCIEEIETKKKLKEVKK